MPYEDFTTYVEVDPNSHISVAANVLTLTGIARNENAYVYKDFGVAYFSGDFTHLVDAIYTSLTGASPFLVSWALGNVIGGMLSVWASPNSALVVYRAETSGGTANIIIIESDGGTQYSSLYADSYSPQNRYHKIVRDELVGANGTIYVYIYSDSARTTLISTLSIALHTSKKDYRYIYAAQSFNYGDGGTFTGRNENLDLNIAPTFEWPGNTNKPIFDIKKQQYLYPSISYDPIFLTLPENINLDKWAGNIIQPLFDIKRQQYLYSNIQNWIIEPILEVVTLDKWYKEINQPKFDIKRQQYLYPSIIHDVLSLLSLEPITIDKWYKEFSKPIFDIKRQQYLYPTTFTDLRIFTNFEDITLDKWAGNTIQPIFATKRQQHLYPNIFYEPFALILLEGITLDKWYININQPIFDVKRQQYLYPVIFYDTNSLNQSELITLDKWYKEVNKPIFDIKRQQYLYPYKGYDSQIYLKPIIRKYLPLGSIQSNWNELSFNPSNWETIKDA